VGYDVQDPNDNNQTLGVAALVSRGIPTHNSYYWVAVGALLLTIVIFNVIYVVTLTYLSRMSTAQSIN